MSNKTKANDLFPIKSRQRKYFITQDEIKNPPYSGMKARGIISLMLSLSTF